MNKLTLTLMTFTVIIQILTTINMARNLAQRKEEARNWCKEQKLGTLETYEFCKGLFK